MALSGTVNTTDYQGRYVQLTWTGTQDTSKNQTTISWTLKGAGEASSSWYNSGPFYVNVGGTEKTSSSRIKLYNGTEIMTGSKTITHDSKGEASVKITVKAAIYAADYNKSGEKTFTLNTIPRKATITAAPDFDDEDNPKVEYSNPAGGSLQIGIYKTDGSTAIVGYRSCSGSSYTFNFTNAERTALQNACKTANSMSVRIYLRTTISGTNYHHYVTKTLSIINADPVINPTAVEDVNADTDGGDGAGNIAATGSNMRWIYGISDVRYAFNPTFKKGATLASCTVACGSPFEDNKTSGVLYNVGSDQVYFILTDSRGNTVRETIPGSLVDRYAKPSITASAIGEITSETNIAVTLAVKGYCYKGQIKSGVDNTFKIQTRYRVKNGTWSSWADSPYTATKGNGNYSYNITSFDASKFTYKNVYEFQARIQDQYTVHQSTAWVTSGTTTLTVRPIFDWSGEDFNFNVPVKFSGDEWHDLKLEGGFMLYNNNANHQPKYKVCGNMVFVNGVVTPGWTLTPNTTSTTFASGIPAEYRPKITQHCVCQGSGINRWLLAVGTDGNLTMARYGVDDYVAINNGTWLPFSFTYMI